MRACGGDDVICPPGSPAPIKVASGFYTTDHWDEGCKPGDFVVEILKFFLYLTCCVAMTRFFSKLDRLVG